MKLANIKYLLITALLLVNSCGNQEQPLMPELPAEPQVAPQTEVSGITDKRIQPIILYVLSRYDHDRSGGIDYRDTNNQWKTMVNKNENYFNEKYLTENNAEIRTITMSKLFIAADRDKNGIATEAEMNSFITENYDKNKDGYLQSRGMKFWQEKAEYQYFLSDVGEEYKNKSEITFNQQPARTNNATQNNRQSPIKR